MCNLTLRILCAFVRGLPLQGRPSVCRRCRGFFGSFSVSLLLAFLSLVTNFHELVEIRAFIDRMVLQPLVLYA